MAAPIGQNNWRYCNKCFGLFYYGNPTNGVCPAGGAHNAFGVSWDYCLIADPVILGQGAELAPAVDTSGTETSTVGKPAAGKPFAGRPYPG
jgi:hypothetical protein